MDGRPGVGDERATTGGAHGPLGWSPAWVVESAGDDLVLSAGRDRRIAVDGLSPTSRAAVASWQSGGRPAPASEEEQALVDRLVAVGALTPLVTPAWKVVLVGEPVVTTRLEELLTDESPSAVALSVLAGAAVEEVGPRPGDLAVAVRTGATWPTGVDDVVHLGLDLALHHTIVLGPLVIPGASTCLDCLDARIARRWPPTALPDRPAVQRSLAVAAGLLRVQVELVAAGASPLVNATVAWDIERGLTDQQPVYKLPGCPRCDTGARSGRVTLPWEADP